MSDRAWKRNERAIAGTLGGQRVPVSGRGDGPDVAHPLLAIEVKERKALPAWTENAMRQAVNAAVAGKIPVVILHQLGRRHTDDVALLRLSDLKRLLAMAGGEIGGNDVSQTA